MFSYRKVGGLHFFKCGRFGMSCYASKRKRQVWRDASGASAADYGFAVCLGITAALLLFYDL